MSRSRLSSQERAMLEQLREDKRFDIFKAAPGTTFTYPTPWQLYLGATALLLLDDLIELVEAN